MKLNIQNLTFLQRNIQKTGLQRGVQEKLAAVIRQRNTDIARQAQPKVTIVEQPERPLFTISKGNVPAATAREMERYYQSAGNAVDNLTCMEEQIKYMKSEYDRALAAGDTNKAEVLDKWMKDQCKDMSWLLTSSLGISHFRIDNAARLYGEAFGKEANTQLRGLFDGNADMLQDLKSVGSAEDALERLSSVKGQLMQRADNAASLYEAYTGEQLAPYTYKTAEDYAGIKWDSHIIYNRELSDLKDSDLTVNLGGFREIDFSRLNKAQNRLDVQA